MAESLPDAPPVSPPEAASRGKGSEWARKYPPLITILVALVLAIAVLPSALNLPQTNPTQTLEYAPVPPNDEDQPRRPTATCPPSGWAPAPVWPRTLSAAKARALPRSPRCPAARG
jgi:hypothetical protein